MSKYSLFGKDFYPSPEKVCEVLIKGIPLKTGLKILEPSAGNGNIIEYYINELIKYYEQKYGFYKYFSEENLKKEIKQTIFAIEINTDLRNILEGKNICKIVDKNFLFHNPDIYYDWIIMNPPYSDGIEHIIKALEIRSKIGCGIRCIINSVYIDDNSTIRKERFNNLIRANNVQITNLGNIFVDAERSTNIDICLLHFETIDMSKEFNYKFEYQTENFNYNSLIDSFDPTLNLNKFDIIESIVNQYEQSKEALKEYFRAVDKLKFYTNNITEPSFDLIKVLNDNTKELNKKEYELIMKDIRLQAWKELINQTKLNELMTSTVKDEFIKFQDTESNFAFNQYNIDELCNNLLANKYNIFMKSISDIFDYMTTYHYKNKLIVEGWKTNDPFKINIKCIFPNVLNKYNVSTCINHNFRNKLEDIEKTLCFIKNINYNQIKPQLLHTLLWTDNDCEFGIKYNSYFFEFILYKKGTLHIKFNDIDLYNQLNKLAWRQKNWIQGDFI